MLPAVNRGADNPTAAELRSRLVAARAAAERTLWSRPVRDILSALDRVVNAWLRPESLWLRRAELELPSVTGFTAPMIRHGMPVLLAPLRAEAIRGLLDDELGDHRVLDVPVNRRRARGLPLVGHVLSGNIPGLAAFPLLLSLAVKSAGLIKVAAGDTLFPALLHESLAEVDADLASCVVIADWRGGDAALEAVAFGEADLVVASGTDAAISAIQPQVTGRFIGHGHKVSCAAVGREGLTTDALAGEVAKRLAYDVSLWDQQGCLSPHVCFVEDSGTTSPERFAELVAVALDEYAALLPPRRLTFAEEAAVSRFRQEAEWEEGDARVLASHGSTAWSVSFSRAGRFRPSCLNRCLRIEVVESLAEVPQRLTRYCRHLEAVGLVAAPPRFAELADQLSAVGVHRVCAVGAMQRPTLSWRQGGRPRVADWVEWTGIEQESMAAT